MTLKITLNNKGEIKMSNKKINDVDIDFTVNVENEAFEDNLNIELKRILKNAIENMYFKEDRNYILRDINGNNVGNVKLTIYEE